MITFKNKHTNTDLTIVENRPYYKAGYFTKEIVLFPNETLKFETGIVVCLTNPNEFVFVKGEGSDNYGVITDSVGYQADKLISGKYYEEIIVLIKNYTNKTIKIPAKTTYMKLYASVLKGFNEPALEDELTNLKKTDLGEGFIVFYDDKTFTALQEPTLYKEEHYFLAAGFQKNDIK